VDGVAAEIAKEISVFLQHDDRNPGASQQEAGHQPAGPPPAVQQVVRMGALITARSGSGRGRPQNRKPILVQAAEKSPLLGRRNPYAADGLAAFAGFAGQHLSVLVQPGEQVRRMSPEQRWSRSRSALPSRVSNGCEQLPMPMPPAADTSSGAAEARRAAFCILLQRLGR